MSFQEDIAGLQVRVAKAESERDNWRVSGMQEKYEAYSMVEALELQRDLLLDLLRQAARLGARPWRHATRDRPAVGGATSATGGPPPISS